MANKKELHFFDDENIDWSCPDYDQLYHRHFTAARPTQICGEVTPIYSYWPPSLGRIQAYNQDVKIIVSLRDPRERAYSHWRMERSRNSDTQSFSAAIRQGRDRVTRGSEISGYHRNFSYVERGFYVEQLNRIFSLFPDGNVLLLDQRILASMQHEVLDEICDFLKIARFATHPPAEMIFSHLAASIPPFSAEDRAYLDDLYREELHALSMTYGVDFAPDQ